MRVYMCIKSFPLRINEHLSHCWPLDSCPSTYLCLVCASIYTDPLRVFKNKSLRSQYLSPYKATYPSMNLQKNIQIMIAIIGNNTISSSNSELQYINKKINNNSCKVAIRVIILFFFLSIDNLYCALNTRANIH